jgi:hypothetical protein
MTQSMIVMIMIMNMQIIYACVYASASMYITTETTKVVYTRLPSYIHTGIYTAI